MFVLILKLSVNMKFLAYSDKKQDKKSDSSSKQLKYLFKEI